LIGRVSEHKREQNPDDLEFVSARRRSKNPGSHLVEVLIWNHVSVHDNFFLISAETRSEWQIIAKAGKAGLRFGPKQLFQHPDIAELITGVSPTSAAGGQKLTPVDLDQLNNTVADYPAIRHTSVVRAAAAATPSACAIRVAAAL